MTIRVPHVLPYQGSKRKLANKILSYVDFKVNKLYEPFAGSAALTLAAANSGIAEKYIFGDKLEVLSDLWELVVNDPNQLANDYEKIWRNQLDNPNEYYNMIRKKFNENHEPSLFLYLAARCVKNAIRFNSLGEFNQGMDKRRLGTRPEKMKKEILLASSLLKNKCEIRKGDFREIIKDASSNDLIYMDPPWQGTSKKTNPRYAFLLDLNEFIESIEDLNNRNVPFIISFDGVCGDKKYGKDLPKHLELTKLVLDAGRSTQSTLLGENSVTLESLYLSKHFNFFEKTIEVKELLHLSFEPELAL
jgi:DNA adenine methylase